MAECAKKNVSWQFDWDLIAMKSFEVFEAPDFGEALEGADLKRAWDKKMLGPDPIPV
jgi:hypothetical protein